jgi:PhnB protein
MSSATPYLMVKGAADAIDFYKRALGGSTVGLLIYLENVDTVFTRALDAGGKSLRPIATQFYGDRSGTSGL